MEKEMCLKFLVHLHACSGTVLRKNHIEAVDLVYINNEVETFLRRIDWAMAEAYDRTGALRKIGKVKEETVGDKAKFMSKFLLKRKFFWLGLLFGTRDDAHVQREAKVLEFKETVRKVLALVEFAAVALLLGGCLPREAATEIKLRTTAFMVTAKCPRKLDAETELVKVTGTGRTLTYDYRLIRVQAADDSTATRIQSLRPHLLKSLCSNDKMQEEFFRLGVRILYVYHDAESRPVTEIEIRPEDCAKKVEKAGKDGGNP